MLLHVLFVVALPMCLAQFSIQGPSDGHRRAQGLKYSSEKGIEYTDQNESQGVGDFTIQGATDGHSNFQIQGASDGQSDFQIQGATDGHSNFQIQGPTDGHSNFQIQGATDGGADAFHIQGATDAHSQSVIQGPYDPNNQGAGKSLQYNDPSGLRVNWRSYDRRQPAAAQPEQQYIEPARPQAPRRQHPQRAQQPQAQPQAQHVSQPVYRPYDNAPAHLKQLLQFQHQLPYVNIIPEPFRYETLAAERGQQQEQGPRKEQAAHQPPYRPKGRHPSRQRRQAPQHQSRQQQQGAAAPQYRRIAQPPADPQIRYNTNVPTNLQNLLKYQSQIPYVNVIPEPFRFDTDAAVRDQQAQVQAHFQNLARNPQPSPQQQPQQQPQQHRPAGHPRQKRQAQQQHAVPQQPQYRRISQPAQDPLPNYSTNLPNSIRDLLKYQAQIPYNIYSNQVSYKVDKYTPQAAPPSAPAQPAPQQPQYQEAALYQPQAPQAQYQAEVPQALYQPQAPQAQYQPQAPQAQYQPQAPQVQYQPTAQAQYQPQAPQAPQAQYQQSQLQQPQYSQPDSPLYRPAPYQSQQGGAYTQAHFIPEAQYPQLGGYGSGVRPVKENQY